MPGQRDLRRRVRCPTPGPALPAEPVRAGLGVDEDATGDADDLGDRAGAHVGAEDLDSVGTRDLLRLAGGEAGLEDQVGILDVDADPLVHGALHARPEHECCTDQRRSRSEEHTSALQSLMRISYAVFCLKKKKNTKTHTK